MESCGPIWARCSSVLNHSEYSHLTASLRNLHAYLFTQLLRQLLLVARPLQTCLWTVHPAEKHFVVLLFARGEWVLIATTQLSASADSRQAALTLWTGPSSAGTGRRFFRRCNEARPRQKCPFWSSCSSCTSCQSARLRRSSGECL